jgi:hypothetical protein
MPATVTSLENAINRSADTPFQRAQSSNKLADLIKNQLGFTTFQVGSTGMLLNNIPANDGLDDNKPAFQNDVFTPTNPMAVNGGPEEPKKPKGHAKGGEDDGVGPTALGFLMPIPGLDHILHAVDAMRKLSDEGGDDNKPSFNQNNLNPGLVFGAPKPKAAPPKLRM